jgi:glycosyltransferase involved in cell wall biosynthesis
LGNLDPNKNLIRLLEAFALLKHDAKVSQQLVIVGRTTWFYEILIDKIRRLGIEGQVIFTGYVPEDELCGFYSGADIFVMPSYLEGFGLPVLEAMACGVPVAAANGGSLPEIVGKAGLLMDPFETEAIAMTIHTLVNQPTLRQELREKGFQRSKDFSWEKMALEIFALYQEVYSENGRPAT